MIQKNIALVFDSCNINSSKKVWTFLLVGYYREICLILFIMRHIIWMLKCFPFQRHVIFWYRSHLNKDMALLMWLGHISKVTLFNIISTHTPFLKFWKLRKVKMWIQWRWIYLVNDARNSAKMSLLIIDLTTFTAPYLRIISDRSQLVTYCWKG